MELLKVSEIGEDTAILTAAQVLCRGGVAVIPTETVYGLACRMDDKDALQRLYDIKTRDRGKPIAILASDPDLLKSAGFTFREAELALAGEFWPGALTLVLQRGDIFEGVRVPDHVLARKLCAACGGCLRVTSANQSGESDIRDAIAAAKAVGQGVDLIVDDGPSAGGIPSTVVKCSDEGFDILREGAISHNSISRIIERL